MDKPQHMNCIVSEFFWFLFQFLNFTHSAEKKKKKKVVVVTNAGAPSYREFDKYQEVWGVYITSPEIAESTRDPSQAFDSDCAAA